MMEDPIANFINTYHDFNLQCVDEFSEQPSALDFMRYVATKRPFVVRQGAEEWQALRKWNAAYLYKVMGEQSVNVATTPFG
jgi:jumonji domain-containing protein 7